MKQRTATILLVDDDEMNRDALSRRLERSGYHVLLAEGGERALELSRTQHVDLVLLDVMMPGMSGIETLKRMRESRALSELPIIMVTANNTSGDMVEALDLGANDYISKPVDYAVAQARIRTQLTARRSDPLTGLPNRVLFMDRLDAQLSRRTASTPSEFALFFIDVDRFKVVNDSLGHLAGDELLTGLAQRFQQSLRATDVVSRVNLEFTLARLGGDEFTVLLGGVKHRQDAVAVAERLIAVASQPFTLQGREVTVTLSVGIVMSDGHYASGEDMLRDADTAMYHAKSLGKARAEIFETSMRMAADERLAIETDLRQALQNGELRLDYQPIVSLPDESLRGFEALLRWQHPTRGLIMPDQFIGVAEETGLIIPIGRWVLSEACRQMRTWDVEFPGSQSLTINVNLSVRQCVQPDLTEDVKHVLEETGLAPERLKLEVTESIMAEGTDRVSEILGGLHALGVQLGLDDFGMGYSGLGYLQRFPFQTIKIDRSFVRDLNGDGNGEIVRAITSLAAGLAMNVTAEGVETAEQAEKLHQLSCEYGQGYFFHRPLTSDKVRTILEQRRWPVPDKSVA